MFKLLQCKVPVDLKMDLDFIADYKGIPVTALIKWDLKELVRREKLRIFTEDGLTFDQELEVLRREKEAMKEYNEGKLAAKSGKEILKELNA